MKIDLKTYSKDKSIRSLHFAFCDQKTFGSERKRWITVSGADLQQVLRLVRRRNEFRNLSSVRLYRQIEEQSVAELIIPTTPNEERFLSFGSRKFREQLLEFIWLWEYGDPDRILLTKLISDNHGFYKNVLSRCYRLRENNLTRQIDELDLFVFRVLLILTSFGVRSVGGLQRSETRTLRLVRKLPRDPRRTVFRRGYRDKGTLAPNDLRSRRIVAERFGQFLEQIVYELQGMTALQVTKVTYSEDGFAFLKRRKPGFSWDDDEVDIDFKTEINTINVLDRFIFANQSLNGEIVASVLTTLLTRGL